MTVKNSPVITNEIHALLGESSQFFIGSLEALAIEAMTISGGDATLGGRIMYDMLASKYAGQQTAIDIVTNLTIPSRGSHRIPLRFYKNHSSATNTVLVYVHGGGWARGSINTHDELCRRLCAHAGVPVISVEYRLAPENPYPAGFEDVEDTYNWLLKNHLSLGVKKPRILLAGDSAGGSISTSLVVKLCQENRPKPEVLSLIYPALDLRVDVQNTEALYDNDCFLTRDRIIDYVCQYLPDPKKMAILPIVSPALADTNILEKFPRTIIISAGSDPLLKQAHDFIAKLNEANVETTHFVAPKVIHIYAQFFGLFDEAHESLHFLVEQLKPYIE
jgi:acetyl esterase